MLFYIKVILLLKFVMKVRPSFLDVTLFYVKISVSIFDVSATDVIIFEVYYFDILFNPNVSVFNVLSVDNTSSLSYGIDKQLDRVVCPFALRAGCYLLTVFVCHLFVLCEKNYRQNATT